MSMPSAKRQRTEDVPITRSQPWNDDGNVVLQAAHMQFRVHWSVLGRNSSFFRNMQGLPQPSDEPYIDGCPVVELPDDPVDVEHLLQVLYTPTFLGQETLPLPAVGALIRLGSKYDFQDLFGFAVKRLMSACPTTLADFDALPSDAYKTRNIEALGDHFDIMVLASKHDIMSALPCAYYLLVKNCTLDALFSGIPRASGTTASLSPLDLHRCAVGRVERLLVQQFQPGYTFGWVRAWDFADECTDPVQCCAEREMILACHLDDAEIGALTRLKFLSSFSFCYACREHATRSMTAGRKKTWDELPKIFNLPTWSELKNDI